MGGHSSCVARPRSVTLGKWFHCCVSLSLSQRDGTEGEESSHTSVITKRVKNKVRNWNMHTLWPCHCEASSHGSEPLMRGRQSVFWVWAKQSQCSQPWGFLIKIIILFGAMVIWYSHEFPPITCSVLSVLLQLLSRCCFQEFRNTSTLKTLRDEIVENVAEKLQVS